MGNIKIVPQLARFKKKLQQLIIIDPVFNFQFQFRVKLHEESESGEKIRNGTQILFCNGVKLNSDSDFLVYFNIGTDYSGI